jgi:HSP20 family protein
MNNSGIKIHPISKDDKKPLNKSVGQLSVDIFHTTDKIVILSPIAGVQKEDVHLSVTEDVLVIKGTRKAPHDIKQEHYYTKECFWGDFSRSIVLPEDADTANIAANFELNVLEISIPKKEKPAEEEKTKIIKIAN